MGDGSAAARATLEGYIEQTRLSLRPATMVRVEAVLREFAVWLTVHGPEVAAVSDLRRTHIERYKRHLAQRPSVRGGRLSTIDLAEQLGTLRVCLAPTYTSAVSFVNPLDQQIPAVAPDDLVHRPDQRRDLHSQDVQPGQVSR